VLSLVTAAVCLAAPDTSSDSLPIRQAREAFAKKDRVKLAALRDATLAAQHPLASWVDYWDVTLRLKDARAEDVDGVLARWPGSYVEDRLRNDWLLVLGRRRDWDTFQREHPRFRMNDDREVACYGYVALMLGGSRPAQATLEAAQAAWLAQRDTDEGCQLLGQTLYGANALAEPVVWQKVRYAVEDGRLKLARQTASLLGDATGKAVAEALDQPGRWLQARQRAAMPPAQMLVALAIARQAVADSAEAANLLQGEWGNTLSVELHSWVWGVAARQGAQALRPQALDWVQTAWRALSPTQPGVGWNDETLSWHARAALCLGQGGERWRLTQQAIEAMTPAERQSPTWQYWRARALQGLAPAGAAGDAARAQARQILTTLAASPLHFYGMLAAEDLGTPLMLPAKAAPPTPAEREAAQRHAGLQRALLLIAAGLRGEGVREWNFHLIGMKDRELLAAAQLACEREVWDRCINTSERTRSEIDVAQRYPMPLRNEVMARTREIGLDPAYVYGLIRQESRFVMDARSHVGASGLMQVMPATAKWTAKRIGMTDFRPDMIAERDTNLKIGTAYLKLVLDDQDGMQALAAAAYNAGPGRPRKWRNGPMLEPAIWAENVPFAETRDYVKKVLANATIYAALVTGQPASLKARLGGSVGPRDAKLPSSTPIDLP
jgi:soluble lytic murein transglycosylase